MSRKSTETTSESIKISKTINISSEERKSLKTKKNAQNEPHSYSLFEFGDNSPVTYIQHSVDDDSSQKKEMGKSKPGSKSKGTQHTVKESETDKPGCSESPTNVTETGRGRKTNKSEYNETGIIPNIKQSDENSEITTRKSGKTKRGNGTVNRDFETDNKTNQRGAQKGSGRTEVEEKMNRYKLSVFPISNVLLPRTEIQYGPVETDETGVVEIIINDLKYRVSTSSVKEGYYIQGLDSRFLVSKYMLDYKNKK